MSNKIAADKLVSFDRTLYSKCKDELNSDEVRRIIEDCLKECNIKDGYDKNFLSKYYSPIYTVLRQFYNNLEDLKVLEVGYRIPPFLNFLKEKGVETWGIDVDPYIVEDDRLFKMSIEDPEEWFMERFKGNFDVILERLCLSEQYDEEYEIENNDPRFKNKREILENLHKLMKRESKLILQDDRGTIFTFQDFYEVGFKKVLKDIPTMFNKDAWNVLNVYEKM